MSDIDLLYKIAEIKRVLPPICSTNVRYCVDCASYNGGMENYCNSAEYPPFTAEKQLNIIKFLSTTQAVLIKQNNIFMGFESANPNGLICATNENLNFEEILAGLIVHIWKNLTVKEQQQIKEILQ